LARHIHRLSARTVATLKKVGRHADGNSLYLSISANGGRRWVYLYRKGGKLKEKGLGSARTVALSDARAKADAVRKQLQSGLDPIQEGRKVGGVMTFAECATRFIASNETAWRNTKHRQQWSNTLGSYANPVFGNMAVDQVAVGDILKVIEPIWSEKTETASRVRGRMESVLDWAAARGYRSSENPARWRGHLDKLLPAPRKVTKVVHHPALPFNEIPKFVSELRKRKGNGALALEFTILTAARTGETIGARWHEIDLRNRIWTVPAERMKAEVEHIVPLGERAMAILQGLPQDSEFVFPSENPERPLSNVALLAVLARMKREDITTHGFRSTFKDWASEVTSFPSELAKMALAHTIENKTEAAYRRGKLLLKRRFLMAAWDKYCRGPILKKKIENPSHKRTRKP
jgi:integrase